MSQRKTKQGRMPLPPDEKRESIAFIRLKPDEKRRLSERAKREGLSESTYVRTRLKLHIED